MKRNTARNRVGTTGSEDSRFEFARRHVLTQQKLEGKLEEARGALYNWHAVGHGVGSKTRNPKTPEEREELKALQAAVVDARARLLLHENDGRNL